MKTARYWWGDYHTGTRDELVRSGLIRPEQFPGEPGMPKCSARFYKGALLRRGVRPPAEDEYWLRVNRAGKLFNVSIGSPAAEQETRLAEQHAEARRTEEKHYFETKRRLFEGWTEDQCREHVRTLMRLAITAIGDNALGTDHVHDNTMPFAFRSDEWRVMAKKMLEVWEWLKTCEMVKMPEPSAVDAARQDAEFQRFMQSQCISASDD